MTHGRKPRRVRFVPALNTLDLATSRAAKFTPSERAEMLQPLREALAALREARCTSADWLQLARALLVSLQIEKRGIVRGLSEHLATADTTLTAIADRFNKATGWQPTGLWFNELEDITTFVGLHDFQLSELGVREYTTAYKAAISEGTRLGGSVGEMCRRSQAGLTPILRPGAHQSLTAPA